MYVRLGLANPKEGMEEEALNYFRDVAITVYDQVSGLLGAAACINNEGQLMAWTTWANNDAKEAAMSEFQQNLAGLADYLAEPPTIFEGPMVAGQQYITVPKDGEDPFFARFVLGGGTQEGKTYDDIAEFMTNTVYPAYENVEGIFATAACKVDDNSGFSFNFWTSHDAAHAASDVISNVVQDAVANLIKEAPKELTGQCNVWKNYVDFPVGKI
tara:strand:+ start:1663 stop:2304 length:642 start_codon:yes stop_codon:yes gene_type:complete